jgi:hypothetical protein
VLLETSFLGFSIDFLQKFEDFSASVRLLLLGYGVFGWTNVVNDYSLVLIV